MLRVPIVLLIFLRNYGVAVLVLEQCYFFMILLSLGRSAHSVAISLPVEELTQHH